MRNSVFFLSLLALLAVACARVTPLPPIPSQATSDASEPDNKKELDRSLSNIRKLSMSGPVRVIVEVQVSRRAVDSEYPLSVAESRSLLVKAMLAAGAKLAEPLGEQPLVLLELTTSQIESLMATGLVRNVHLDDIAKTQ